MTVIGRVTGPDFDKILGSSRNHPKSIGIDQESIINYLGIIKTQKWHQQTLKKQEQTQTSQNKLPPIGAPLEPHWSPIGALLELIGAQSICEI